MELVARGREIQAGPVVPRFGVVVQYSGHGDRRRQGIVGHDALPGQRGVPAVTVTPDRVFGAGRVLVAAPPGVVVRHSRVEVGGIVGRDIPGILDRSRAVGGGPSLLIRQTFGGLECPLQGARTTINISGVDDGRESGGRNLVLSLGDGEVITRESCNNGENQSEEKSGFSHESPLVRKKHVGAITV